MARLLLSMEAWVRTEATPGGTVVVASNGTSSNSWGLAVDPAGNAAGFTQNSGGAGFTTMSSTKLVNDGAWHHLVLTRGASTWALSVDGVAKTLSNDTTSPGTPGAGFTTGAWSDGTRAFTGEMDEVAVYTADISGSASAHWAAGRKTDPVTGLTTRNAYDRLGRVTDAWAPDLVRMKAGYDRLGNQTETIANYRDGVTTGGTADDDVRSTFAYDVLGELIGYCPAEEVKVGGCTPSDISEVQAWHYEFDKLGRQTKTIPPDNTAITDLTTEEVVYELGGRIGKTCRYPAGTSCGAFDSRHVDLTYDKLGRILTQKTWDRGASPAADSLKFTKTVTWNADGSPATVNEGADTLSYLYDTAGRLSEVKRGSTVLTAYTYTAGTSTIATRTDGTQDATAFEYDWARRQTLIDPPDAFVAGTVSRTYRLDGLLATQSFPASLTESLAYDAAKRPVSISLGSAGSISQTFDRAGNVTSDGRSLTGITGDAGTGTQAFTYDGLSRLTGSTGLAGTRSYQYDLDGNRTHRVEGSVTTDFTYDRADQLESQTIGVTTRTFDYDRYGNLLQGADAASATTTYAYDEASRLRTINPPGGGATQITFTLDALDRHAGRLVNGSTTDTYSYLDATETAWQTGSGTPTSSLLDADGTRLAVKTGSTVSWLVFDLHGSVVALCPAGSSTLSDAYRFDGWGQQIASSGSATNPFRYRGLLNIGSDALTGALLDMAARHYSPQLGAFTQQDSVQGSAANPVSMNRFLYAHANPATLIDPDGHMAVISTDTGGNLIQPRVYSCISSMCDPNYRPASSTTTTADPGPSGDAGPTPQPAPMPCTSDRCPGMFPIPPLVASEPDDTAALHASFEICGMVNPACSLADAGVYARDGDYLGGLVALLTALPFTKALKHAPGWVISLFSKASRLQHAAFAAAAARLLQSGRPLASKWIVAVSPRTGRIVYEGPIDLSSTLADIAAGKPKRAVFRNDPYNSSMLTGPLPDKPKDYYAEYLVPTPGIAEAGTMRLVIGMGGEVYFTPSHYMPGFWYKL